MNSNINDKKNKTIIDISYDFFLTNKSLAGINSIKFSYCQILHFIQNLLYGNVIQQMHIC